MQLMTSRQEFCSARVKEAKASSVSWFDYLKTGQLFASLQAYFIKSVTKVQHAQEESYFRRPAQATVTARVVAMPDIA